VKGRLIARGRIYIDGALIHQWDIGEDDDHERGFIEHVGRFKERMIAKPHMIEMEFLDEPVAERFIRFGTDPNGMIIPLPVDMDRFIGMHGRKD